MSTTTRKDLVVPTFPTFKSLLALSRIELTTRLKEYEADWEEFPDDDLTDPFESEPGASKRKSRKPLPSRQELEHAANASHLHSLMVQAWVNGLSERELWQTVKLYKIEVSSWERRTASISDLRKTVLFGLPSFRE